MEYRLVAVKGKSTKGGAWLLGEEGLLVGRDPTCDVVLDDPAVSRRHCRLKAAPDGRVSLEDLGSRNPALVNGLPIHEGLLEAGDQIVLGNYEFLLASGREARRVDFSRSHAAPTVSWDRGDMVALDVDTTKPATHNRPRTLKDLALLHEITCDISAAASAEDLLRILYARIEDRFKPVCFWAALADPDTPELECLSGVSSPQPPPLPLLHKALQERKALLEPVRRCTDGKKELLFSMACPVLLASRSLAVLALQSDLSHGVYDEEDLRFLVLLAQSLAPALYALKSIEQLRRDNELLRGSAAEPLRILGNSRAIRHVRALVAQAAKSALNVLVLGETGTGKELAARSIHILSPRRTRPLVVVNCAAIPRDLFESEVFGHVKGAFTGAVEPSEGLLAQASGGTLFLDEVGDLSLENQARLLRAVDTGTFRQVGAKQESRVDIRVVAATNMDIAAAVREGSFRKDLYHRLNGFEIQIPPLRERPSDIPILAQHFFDLGRNRAKRPLRGMTPESLAYLASRSWPGNVRELRNVVERGIASTTRDVLMPQNLIESRSDSSPEPTGEELTLESVQLRHIAEILRQCGGNVPQAARILQISRSSLYAKIAEYGLQV